MTTALGTDAFPNRYVRNRYAENRYAETGIHETGTHGIRASKSVRSLPPKKATKNTDYLCFNETNNYTKILLCTVDTETKLNFESASNVR